MDFSKLLRGNEVPFLPLRKVPEVPGGLARGEVHVEDWKVRDTKSGSLWTKETLMVICRSDKVEGLCENRWTGGKRSD